MRRRGSRWGRRTGHTLIFLLLSPALLVAQQADVAFKPDILRFGDGVLHTYSAPARWKGKDWLVLGGIVAGTSALTFLDQPVRGFWQNKDSGFLDGLERVGYHYGKPYTAFAFTGGFYLTGMLFKSEWAKETGLILGTTLLTSGSIMGILKNVAGRARPAPGQGNLEFSPFDKSPAWHSFPSGHSTMGFSISLVVARRVDNVPLKIFFYSLAGVTAMSRMYTDSHWISDVSFGGMLAWFCADTAIDRMQMNRFRSVRRKENILVWNVYPYPGGLTLRASVR
ncbi:MAG TPA: phosphatase PAP2 family protein [Chryseosolibacter sp.]|nr:phosphatase PAP2 family protein [Chryseosolibacter sp.]